MQANIHIGLQREQISHPEQTGVHRRRMFDLEGSDDRSSPDPYHVDQLDRFESCKVVTERKFIQERGMKRRRH